MGDPASRRASAPAPADPGLPAGADQVVAAVRGRPQHEVGPGQLGERLVEVLRRERRAVAAGDHDDIRAGGKELGEDAGQPLAEPLAALPEARPARTAREGVYRGGGFGNGAGPRPRRCFGQHERGSRDLLGGVQRAAEQTLVHGESAVVAERRRQAGLDGAAQQRARHHCDGPAGHRLSMATGPPGDNGGAGR